MSPRVIGIIIPAILELVEKRGKITAKDVAEAIGLDIAQARNIISQMQRYHYPTSKEPYRAGRYLVRLNKGEKVAVYGRGERMSPSHLKQLTASGDERYVGNVHKRGT